MIRPESDVRHCTYVVYPSGSLYKAKAREGSGKESKAESNCATLLNALLAESNVSIGLVEGTYPISSALTASGSNITLKGINQFSSIIQASASMSQLLTISGAGIHLENLCFDGNSNATDGVHLNAGRSYLHHIEIKNFTQDGLVVSSSVSGGRVSFLRVSMPSSSRYGINFDGVDMEIFGTLIRGISGTSNRPTAAYYITGGGGSKFIGGHTWGTVNAVILEGANRVAFIGEALNDTTEHAIVFQTSGSYDVRFRGCEHKDVCRSADNTYDVYYVNVNVARISILGCEAVAALTNKPRYFLNQASGTGTGCLLVGNMVRNMQTGFVSGWSNGVNNCVVANNVSY